VSVQFSSLTSLQTRLYNAIRYVTPRFDNSSYSLRLSENTRPGSRLIRLHASLPSSAAGPGARSDPKTDSRMDPRIVYRFSRRTRRLYGNVFDINSTIGQVTLLSAVTQPAYNLSVCTTAIYLKVKKLKGMQSFSWETNGRAMERHLSYEIIQCYLLSSDTGERVPL